MQYEQIVHWNLPADIVYNKKMRVPVFEEIKLSKFDVMSIVDQFRRSKVGMGPCSIDLRDKNAQEMNEICDVIEDALTILKVSAKIPYPIYIFTNYTSTASSCSLIKGPEQLPFHFIKRVKRLTSKELSLLNKSVTLTQRILNLPLRQRERELEVGLRFHKKLFQLSKEMSFYEDIQTRLEKKER